MDRRIVAGHQVRRDHATEQGGVQARATDESFQIVLSVPVLEIRLDGLFGVLRIVRREVGGEVGEERDLGLAENDDLLGVQSGERFRIVGRFRRARSGGARPLALAEDGGADGLQDAHNPLIREFPIPQALRDDIAEDPPGANGLAGAEFGERPLPGLFAPVTLQALGRYADAVATAERKALRPADIVAVEKRGGIARQGVDLQEIRSHGFRLRSRVRRFFSPAHGSSRGQAGSSRYRSGGFRRRNRTVQCD